MLQSLHENHPGISRMKSIARSYVWWYGLDKAIEQLAHSCLPCQAVKNVPAAAPLHPWIWPNAPWTRIHMDFTGPFQGHMFFVVVDAHSKWPEVVQMSTTTTAATLKALRDMFAQHGLPEQMVSDNGPQFVSDEFATFAKKNGIRHIRCAPYHPASNGLAERFVQTFKWAMKASHNDGRSPSHRLAEFLMTYRATPHATTGVSPATLFLHRKIRTRFDLLRPDTQRNVHVKQATQKTHHDKQASLRQLQVGQPVMAKDFRHGTWQPGVITSIKGPLSYVVTLGDGRVWNRHVDHVRKRELPTTPRSNQTPDKTAQIPESDDDFHGSFADIPTDAGHPPPQPMARHYPVRNRRAPDRLDPSTV